MGQQKYACTVKWVDCSRRDVCCPYSVADPGFPRRGGGANPEGGGANLLFGQCFPKNSMKMKEIGPGGGRTSLARYLDPSMALLAHYNRQDT